MALVSPNSQSKLWAYTKKPAIYTELVEVSDGVGLFGETAIAVFA
jgi:hypothetical protein